MSIDERMQVVSCDIKHLYSVRSFLERIGRSPLFSKEALQQSELQQENIIAENTANPALENDPFDWSSQHYVEPVLYRSYQEAEAEFNASSQSTCIHVRSYGLNSAPPPERSLDELTTRWEQVTSTIPLGSVSNLNNSLVEMTIWAKSPAIFWFLVYRRCTAYPTIPRLGNMFEY
jgi:hypothetical protein